MYVLSSSPEISQGNVMISIMRDLYKSENDKASAFCCLGFSSDGKFLATGEWDGDVKVAFPCSKVHYNT